MILFPRRDGKHKKGVIHDSTADKLKSAPAEEQNRSKHVIEKPRRKLKEKAQKITKEMRDFKAFRKLRQERINAYYMGQREKRAKEKAEKEKEK